MKNLRVILPHLCLTLCFGFLAFMACEVILSKPPEKTNLSKECTYTLFFQAGHVDSSSMFTRQAGGGENDSADPEAMRSGSRVLALLAITFQSRTLSADLLTRQHQWPPISVMSGSRTLLYRRLII